MTCQTKLLLTTLRQSRQLWAGLLLVVMLGLLPLRGWAEIAMHLSTPAPQSVTTEVSLLPCHASMGEHAGAIADESASGCSFCSLCHGTALCMSELGIVPDVAGASAQAAAPQGHGPPDLPLLERPPRA